MSEPPTMTTAEAAEVLHLSVRECTAQAPASSGAERRPNALLSLCGGHPLGERIEAAFERDPEACAAIAADPVVNAAIRDCLLKAAGAKPKRARRTS